MKFYTCLILLFCFSLPAFAQEEEEGRKKIPETYNLGKDDNPFVAGVIFGGNTATMTADNFSGFHNVGFSAGFTVYTRLAARFWVGTELLYVKRGVTGVRLTESYYWGPYMEKYYMRMNTAELPVLFHLFGRPAYHFSFGVSYWRVISSKESLFTSPVTIYPDQSIYSFNKNNFDMIVGGGLHLNPKVYLNVRWQRSLSPVRNWENVHPYTGAGNQYMTHCSLQLMYLLR